MKYYFSIDKSNKNKTYEKDCYGVVNNNLITDGCKNWQCSHSEYNIMNSEQWKQNTFGCTYIKRFHCCNNREGIVSPWRPKTCPTMTSELSSRGSEKSKKKVLSDLHRPRRGPVVLTFLLASLPFPHASSRHWRSWHGWGLEEHIVGAPYVVTTTGGAWADTSISDRTLLELL
jgi:hypothetical protein